MLESPRKLSSVSRRLQGTVLTMLAAAWLVAVVVPFLHSTAEARPRCEDGSPPPCDIDVPDPEPDRDPPPHPQPPDDPEPPPPPNLECDDPAGFARPVGTVPPGYVYTPTSFTGVVADPQPDDTFAADAPGRAAYVGRLRTRVANGREEFLVCAHVGTNTPDDALTPFPLTGPGAHPATIAPRIVIIDAVGNASTYDFVAAGITGSLSHYAGSADVHESFVQMWVPFTFSLHEPGLRCGSRSAVRRASPAAAACRSWEPMKSSSTWGRRRSTWQGPSPRRSVWRSTTA